VWGRIRVVEAGGTERGGPVLAGGGPPDLEAVDVVARWALGAVRRGGRVRLVDVTPSLRSLLDLAGLVVEMEGQTERREQPLRVQPVQEEVDRDDRPA